MTRLILLILLLTVVYSWEELKYVMVNIWAKLFNRNTNYQNNWRTDVLVSDAVLVATIPLSLAYLILSSANLPLKLFILLAEYILVGLLLKGVQEYFWRRRFTAHYEGRDKIIAILFSIAGLVSPSFRFASQVTRSTTRIGKYLFALSLPLASGLALAITIRKWGVEEFTSRLDTLIAIATLALGLNVTIEILEHIFKSYRWHLMGLMRVVLGIAIIFALAGVF